MNNWIYWVIPRHPVLSSDGYSNHLGYKWFYLHFTGKKSYDKPRKCIKKQRHYLKVCIVKAMVFPVVMYGCESWTIKEAEHRSIDAFKLWCWRRLLRVPWTARRSNQSILKEISPDYALEGLMHGKEYAPVFWPLDTKSRLIEEDSDAGKEIESKRTGGSREWDS